MILASRLCRHATRDGLFWAAAFYAGLAAAQTPAVKMLTFGGSDVERLAELFQDPSAGLR